MIRCSAIVARNERGLRQESVNIDFLLQAAQGAAAFCERASKIGVLKLWRVHEAHLRQLPSCGQDARGVVEALIVTQAATVFPRSPHLVWPGSSLFFLIVQ